MICALIPKHLKSFTAAFFEKTSIKSKYLARTITSSTTNKAIWASQARCIVIWLKRKKVIYTMKASKFLSSAALANFFLSMSSTHLVIDRTLTGVYNRQISSFSANYTSTLLRFRKSMPKIPSILMLASKKIFWKNRALSSLSLTWKFAKTIPNIWRIASSIF